MLRTLIALLLAVGLAVVPASADHDKEKGKSKGKGKDKGHDNAVATERDHGRREVFSDRDRDEVRGYWLRTYGRGKCPPGLAKKNNGCRPPGQAKERYVVGQRLPAVIVVQPAPRALVTRLGPPAPGYQYVMLDGDLLKLAVGTRLVVDAIHAVVD
jgi:Ni/Co efflux regulator RcnB